MTLHIDPGLKELVRDQLDRQEEGRFVRATRPVTTVAVRATGGLQVTAEVEGHSFVADEREDKGGTDTGPAPLRYFLGGVAMCHQVWTIKSAALADVQLDDIGSEIAGYLEFSDSDVVSLGRGFSRVEITMRVHSPAPTERVVAVVKEGADRCAAMVTVRRSSSVDLVILHNGEKVLDEREWGAES